VVTMRILRLWAAIAQKLVAVVDATLLLLTEVRVHTQSISSSLPSFLPYLTNVGIFLLISSKTASSS